VLPQAGLDPLDMQRVKREVGRERVLATPPEGPERAMYLSGLGLSLQARYLRLGDPADLDAAVAVGEEAVRRTPDEHPARAGRLLNLGAALLERFARSQQLDDLDRSVVVHQGAVASPGPAWLAAAQANLGISLALRAQQTLSLTDLDEAIASSNAAVAATAADHPSRARRLSNLAISLRRRFERTQDDADLDQAVSTSDRAVDALPVDHPDRAALLANLAVCLRLRYQRTGDQADRAGAVSLWRSASRISAAPAWLRLDIVRNWASTAMTDGEIGVALEGYQVAAELLPQAVWLGLDRAAREDHLTQWINVPAASAACAILAQQPVLAAELADSGRGVLWSQLLQLRNDLTALARQAPELAARLAEIRTSLEAAGPDVADRLDRH